MIDYTTNGKKEYELFKKIINKNLKELKKSQQPVIRVELLPDNLVIRSLYGEQLMSLYCGLFNSSLSIGMELLEYMTKYKYSEIYKCDYPKKDWSECLKKLKINYSSCPRKSHLLSLVDIARASYRNSQNHGNLLQLLDKSNPMCELNLDRVFDQSKPIFTGKKFKTSEVIKDPAVLSDMLSGVYKRAVTESIALVNIFLVEFFILDLKN